MAAMVVGPYFFTFANAVAGDQSGVAETVDGEPVVLPLIKTVQVDVRAARMENLMRGMSEPGYHDVLIKFVMSPSDARDSAARLEAAAIEAIRARKRRT
jgi:hypothetical protein